MTAPTRNGSPSTIDALRSEVPLESVRRFSGAKELSSTQQRAAKMIALHDVVVTGIGAVLPNCDSRETLWQHLKAGQSQLRIETQPGAEELCAMGRIDDFDCLRYVTGVPQNIVSSCHREQQLYLASLALALQDACLDLERVERRRVGLFDGTSRGSFAYWYQLLTGDNASSLTSKELHRGMPGQAVGIAAALFGIKGPTFTYNGTCAAGVIAIGNAMRELQNGRVDVALGTGHDAALIPPMFEMYRSANLVSMEREDPAIAIRPYSGNRGNAFGEGAVTVVLETRAHAEARGAEILAEVVSFSHGNGGQHPTDVDFVGERPAELIQGVLKEGDTPADAVGFVLGHGNGVQASDISELNYMKRVFGRRTRHVPLISTKPIYGHTFGASSALNVAAAALMLHQEFIIPTVGVDESRVVHGFNHQPNRGQGKCLDSGLVMAYGMGGQNAALLLGKDS